VVSVVAGGSLNLCDPGAGASAGDADMKEESGKRNYSPLPAMSSPMKHAGEAQRNDADGGAPDPSPASMGANWGHVAESVQQVSPEPAKAEDGEVSAEQKQEMEIERDQQKTAKDSDRTPLEMQVDAVGAGGQSEETSKEELKSERPKCGSAEKRATAEKGLSGEPLLAVQAPASTPVQESAQTPESRTPVLTAAADDGHGCSGSGSPVPQPPPDYIPPVAASPAQALAVATPASGLQSLAMPFSAGAALKSGEALLHASKPQVPAPYLRKGRPLRPTCDSTGASSNVEPMSKALHENFDSVSLQALANDSTTASTPIGKVSDVPYAHTPKSDLRPAADPRLQYEPFLAQAQASASQQMATPDTNGRGEDTPGSTQEESAQGRGRPGRKPKDLPPGFERVVDGTDKPYWLAPDKTKCTKWPQVEAWLAKRQAGSTPGSGAQSKSVGGKGVGGPTPTRGDFKIGRAVENPIEPERTEKYDVFDPPQDIAEFLGFVVFYLLHHENEDDAYDLINLSPPSIHGVDVNLCELFHHVRELGGVEKMHMRLWKSVLQTMKLPASTQDANTINLIYERFLVCCEGKSWNKEELQKNANRVAGSDKRANLKTLLRRGLLRVGQEFTWKKRRVDYEAEGREPKPDNLEPAAVGKLNEDGHIEFEGSTYKSLNAFAGAAFMHFDIGPKARADKLDGWNSVKTKGTDGRLKSVQQIKNDYHRSNADTMRNAMLRPRELFSNQAHGLRQQKNQAEMREREEKERQQQLEHAKLLAENPPPAWIHPQYDQRYLEEVENGTREATVSMDLEKMIVDLETGTSQDDLDLAENALQQIVDSVLKPTPLTARYHLTLQCITLSPMVLNRLTKCCWGWLCKSSYSAPYGKWQINMNTVKYRLQSELDPKKGRMHWRKQGLARSSIGAPYTASKLPPGWRREERIPDAGPLVHLKKVFYTYFAPDGKTFTRWPDALAYFIETEEAKLKDAEKATAEAGFFDQAAAEGDAGTSGAEEEKGAEDDGDEDGAEDEEEDDEMGDVDDQERRQQQQQQRPSEATSAPGGGAQLWWPPATCRLVMRDLVFGQSFQVTREGGLQAARCARLARAYILMLKHVCLLREGMARVGSHGPTVQLLIEIITADLPAANDSSTPIDTLCLQLLNGIAHVINLKVSPGKRLLTAISHAIRAQGNGAERNRMRLELVHLLARLADCPHNKQVMAEQEHQVLPTVLPLFMFPQGVGGYQMLSMALDAVHRFCLFDAIPSVLRRLNGTPGCIAALVRIVCGAYEPPHRRDQAWRPEGAGKVQLSDRIHAARVLLKVAEGSGGIASLQRHEKELVCPCTLEPRPSNLHPKSARPSQLLSPRACVHVQKTCACSWVRAGSAKGMDIARGMRVCTLDCCVSRCKPLWATRHP